MNRIIYQRKGYNRAIEVIRLELADAIIYTSTFGKRDFLKYLLKKLEKNKQ